MGCAQSALFWCNGDVHGLAVTNHVTNGATTMKNNPRMNGSVVLLSVAVFGPAVFGTQFGMSSARIFY
eukprot:2169725-Amphidinium_carterae.1